MTETLLQPSGIHIYGRVVEDISLGTYSCQGGNLQKDPFNYAGLKPNRVGDNKFLQKQLEGGDAKLARIYGFSYEGHYYDLDKPLIFLVHGDGVPAESVGGIGRRARAPEAVDLTGTASSSGSMSEDVVVWVYDAGDFSLRMDIETGPWEQILLEHAIEEDEFATEVSGKRVSGKRVSGKRVSGKQVSGKRMSGD